MICGPEPDKGSVALNLGPMVSAEGWIVRIPVLGRFGHLLTACAFAMAMTAPVWAADAAVKRDRYMVTLKEGTRDETVAELSSELASKYGFRVITTFTRGVQVGIVAELDAGQLPALEQHEAVERVQKIGPPGPPPPGEAGNKFFRVPPGWAIPGIYYVVLTDEATGLDFSITPWPNGLTDVNWKAKDDAKIAAVEALANDLVTSQGARRLSVFAPTVAGFACAMNERQALRIAADPRVKYVSEAIYTIMEFEPKAAPSFAQPSGALNVPLQRSSDEPTVACDHTTMQFWNRDRVNSRPNECDNRVAEGPADIVHVYVMDTGIKATHPEFGNRVREGYSVFPGTSPYDDCDGHGTGVASIVGGALVGVAKNVILHPVRLADCFNTADPETFIVSINWIRNRVLNERLNGIYYPTIVNLSAGFSVASQFTIEIENAVFALINDAQVLFIAAAGNGGGDASQTTPGRMGWVLQVAATSSNDSRLLHNPISNFGSTVDLFAPGHDIVMAGIFFPHVGASGTSFAAPLVTGVASLARERAPEWRWIDIKQHLEAYATANVVTNQGSHNKPLLYTDPPPAAPSNVQLRRLSPTSVEVSWRDNSSSEFGYAIKRTLSGQVNYAGVHAQGPVPGTGSTVTWVDNNAPVLSESGEAPTAAFYQYRVQASAQVVSASYGPVVNTQNVPSAAINANATAESSTRIRLTWWDSSNNEAGFKIERAQVGGSSFTEIAVAAAMPGVGVREYVDNGVGHGQEYQYRVLAYSPDGHSGYSNTTSAQTPIVFVSFLYENTDVDEYASANAELELEIWPNLQLTSPVTVSYTTYDQHPTGTWAQAAVDYTPRSGTATFPPGSWHGQRITIPNPMIDIMGNNTQEPIEYFHLTLGNPPNGAILHPYRQDYWKHVFFIIDDDTHVSVYDAATVEEGPGEPLDIIFTVTLDRPFGREIRVGYETQGGTAAAGQDYTPKSGTLTFSPGETTKTVAVDILPDALDEDDHESINLVLGSPSKYVQIADGVGTGQIHDEDDPPTMSIAAAHVAEGNTGVTTILPLPVTLSGPSGKVIQVNYQTADLGATAGSDYFAAAGTLIFPAGDISKPIDVSVIGDITAEPAESFRVILSAPQNATIPVGSGEALGTIDPDDISKATIADASVTEGDNPNLTVDVTLTVSLSNPHAEVVTVHYNTLPVSANSLDYIETSGMLTFSPSQTSKTLIVKVKGDPNDEDDETFTVNLSQLLPTGTTQILDGQAIVTILDNDPAPSITFTDASGTEGNCGLTLLSTTATISPPSGKIISWLYESVDGAARAGEDYNAVTSQMGVLPGTPSVALGVAVIGDRVDESNEHLYARLSNITNANVTSAQTLLMILDDDTAPGLTGNDLGHGADQWRTLRANGVADWFAVAEKAWSSYEVVVEGVSGMLGVPGSPIKLELTNCTQSEVHLASQGVGSGDARSLRWENGGPSPQDRQDRLVRVTGACTAGCAGNGVYRVRAYETTYTISRFNNTGEQYTVLSLQNPTSYGIDASIHFWDADGSRLWTHALSLAPRSSLTLDTRTVGPANGKAGSITVSNTGRYGDLVGSAISIDQQTQMSYDTPMLAKPK